MLKLAKLEPAISTHQLPSKPQRLIQQDTPLASLNIRKISSNQAPNLALPHLHSGGMDAESTWKRGMDNLVWAFPRACVPGLSFDAWKTLIVEVRDHEPLQKTEPGGCRCLCVLDSLGLYALHSSHTATPHHTPRYLYAPSYTPAILCIRAVMLSRDPHFSCGADTRLVSIAGYGRTDSV